MPLTSAHWSYAIDPGIQGSFDVAFSRRSSLREALYGVRSSSLASEEIFGSGVIGVDAWEQWEKDGIVPQADYDQIYKKTFTHKEYPLEVQIRKKLFEDAQFASIFDIAAKIGDSAALKRENDAASTFNNAFSDSFAGADSVGLCSLLHPNSPHNANDTQANEGTLALTKANVATTRENMMAFTDDKGQVLGVTPDVLLVPPELEDEALVIVGSLLDPTSANNAINPQSGRFSVVVWHYLTDANAWFMLDSMLMKQHLLWFDRSPVSIVPKVEDKTVLATWIAYMRYSFGWTDWRWVYGNNPS
jgi:hypothetical protein